MSDKVTMILNCPRCRKSTVWDGNPSRPFCSERCRLVDLGAWVNEEYSLAGETVDEQEQSEQ